MMKILGAALQADGESRSVVTASGIRRTSVAPTFTGDLHSGWSITPSLTLIAYFRRRIHFGIWLPVYEFLPKRWCFGIKKGSVAGLSDAGCRKSHRFFDLEGIDAKRR